MRRLFRVELTRLLWRRAVLLLLAASVVIPVVIGVVTVWNTQPPSADEKARIEALVADERESPQVQRDLAQCVEQPQNWGIDPDATDIQAQCEEYVLPRPEWFADYRELDLPEEREQGSGFGVVVIVTLLMVLAGTTFAGNDWNSGSMSNQLLFDARRGRVWTAKAVAVTLVALVTSVVVSTTYWLAMWATMHLRDIPVADGGLTDTLLFGLRGAAFATAAALGGYALTMLFRSTVATVGVLFGVTLAGGIIIAVLGIGEQWQPQKNVSAIVKNGTVYYVDVPESCYSGQREMQEPEPNSECDSMRDLSPWHGVGYYGTALVATVGASVLSFRRRDVP